jgi:hypothetical protein
MIVHDEVMLNDFVNDLVSIMSKIEQLDGVNIRWIFPASPMVKINFVFIDLLSFAYFSTIERDKRPPS